MVVEVRPLLVGTIIVSKIEPHIKEHVSRLQVDLHFGSREAVYEPVQRVVFSYAVIDKLGVLARDGGYTERFARSIILQHSNLEKE